MEKSNFCGTTHSHLRVGLGTFIAIEATAPCPSIHARAIQAANAAIDRVEALMHPTRAGSDLAALATAELDTAQRIDAWTWTTLALCKRLHALSNGVFDPCLDARHGGLRALELPAPETAVLRARIALDLGGIAKGFAVDRAIEVLRGSGCTAGLVNAGGDLAVFGPQPHTLWCRRHGRGTEVRLRDAALASSDADATGQPGEHRGYYNGAARGAAVRGFAAVTAPTAALADGLTKCLLAGRCDNDALLAACGAQRIVVQ